MANKQVRRKILFFITEDWFFVSHFIDRARAARNAGYDVVVATRVAAHKDIIEASGLRLIPVELVRSSLNPLREFRVLLAILRLYRRERPDIVHHIAVKPIVYGTIAARWAQVPAIINAPVGLGYAFTAQGIKAFLTRSMITFFYRRVMGAPNVSVITENPDDAATLQRLGVIEAGRLTVIRGAGVDIEKFVVTPEPEGVPVVFLAARMLWEKGVGEFVEAARLLRDEGVPSRFVLAGAADTENPRAIPTAQLQEWSDSGDIEWLGKRNDMAELLGAAAIVCLPSAYGEGLPKVLLEAAACGRPIVTTDAPGCREIVRHGVNGFLIPVRDARALADAVAYLIEHSNERREMGLNGRQLVEAHFSTAQIERETLECYSQLTEVKV